MLVFIAVHTDTFLAENVIVLKDIVVFLVTNQKLDFALGLSSLLKAAYRNNNEVSLLCHVFHTKLLQLHGNNCSSTHSRAS